MPQFAYRAKQGPEKIVSGVIEATNVDDAVGKLDAMGLLAVRVDEVTPAALPTLIPTPGVGMRVGRAAEAEAAAIPKMNFFGRIKPSEVTIFTRELATLVKAGVPILRALHIISEQTANPRLRKALEHAQNEIRNGNSFSGFLSQYPRLFPPLYLAMVRTGEDSGALQEALYRVADYRQRQEEILSRVRTAMAYPILMALVGVGTVTFMLTFVIPRLSTLFSRMGGNLPLPTRILMAISAVFQQKLFWLAAAAVIFLLVVLVKARKAQAKALWSAVSLRLPVIKGFVVKAELARLSRTLELLIKSGIPILRAIEITTPILGNAVLRAAFGKTREEIAGGGSFGKSLREKKIFPLFMTNLVSVGEESGKLEEVLSEVAVFYERETDEAIKIMTSLLEPLMILVMGLVVGFIVIAMLLPMFELNMIVK